MAKRRTTTNAEKSAGSTRSRRGKDNGQVKSSNRRPVAAESSQPQPQIGPTDGDSQGANDKPFPKTRLSEKTIEQLKEALIHKRRQLVGSMDSLENEALGKNRSSAAGDLSMMPIHMADIGTDNYEQEFTIGLIENERETLKEIDAALQRMKDGTYGICLATRKPISKARLMAKPWARFCIDHKRSQEQRGR